MEAFLSSVVQGVCFYNCVLPSFYLDVLYKVVQFVSYKIWLRVERYYAWKGRLLVERRWCGVVRTSGGTVGREISY